MLNWAGFKGAVTYTFDDDNDSQISNYSMLQAAGGQYTFYLWTGQNAGARTPSGSTRRRTATRSATTRRATSQHRHRAGHQGGDHFIMQTFGVPP